MDRALTLNNTNPKLNRKTFDEYNPRTRRQAQVGDLDKVKKLVKLSVLLSTTEEFVEHAAVADGASDLFVQLFGAQAGHVRVVYGVHSAPIGTPAMVETVFEIE